MNDCIACILGMTLGLIVYVGIAHIVFKYWRFK